MDNNRRLSMGYGLICLVLGILWLLYAMEVLPWRISEYLYTWRFLLVVVGSVLFVKRPKSVFALIVICIGLLSSVAYFWQLPVGWENYLPPFALMIVGSVLLLRTVKLREPMADNDNMLNRATVFGNLKQSVTSVLFKGGDLSCIFGSNVIDFKEAHLGKEEVVLNVFSLFGTNTLIVPSSWEVEIVASNVLGNTNDLRVVLDNESHTEGVLRITGTNLLGNLKIQN